MQETRSFSSKNRGNMDLEALQKLEEGSGEDEIPSKECEIHIQSCEAEMAAARALQEGSIVQQLQKIGDEEKSNNRLAIIALIRSTHFLVCRHIAHTANFDELVDLVVSCGAEDLRRFLEKAGKNASYTSKVAVVEFVEAISVWAEESLLKRLRQASNFSIMADECTDVTTIEELSIFQRRDTSRELFGNHRLFIQYL